MRYLSDDWIAAFDEAVRSDPELRAAASTLDLVIQQTVTERDGDIVYRMVLRDGTARVLVGADPDADVRLTADRATATAIACGQMAAQDAFMQGHLRIGGDVTTLLAQPDLFASVTDLTLALRERTEW